MKRWILLALLLLPFFLQSFAEETSPPPQKAQIALYYAPWCPWSQKVLHYLESIHKQVPLKNVEELRYKEELLKYGGKNIVPCLVVEHTAIYDPSKIIDWLASHQSQLEEAAQ